MSNDVTVSGNLTTDPVLRHTSTGKAVASFSVAENRQWTNASTGEQEEDTSFFSCQVWGSTAEHLAASLGKGDRVVVVGRLNQRSYETTENEIRYVTEIIANEVAVSLLWNDVEVQKPQIQKTQPTTKHASTSHPRGGRK